MVHRISACSNLDEKTRASIIECLEKLPPFSPVLRRVLATLILPQDKISLPHIADVIERDALIAGRILGIANSAAYNRGQAIFSIRHAVARLGLQRVRNAVLAISVTRVWGGLGAPANFCMLRFNQHALAAATASDLFVQHLSASDAEQAFAAGLFHDIGQLVAANLHPNAYATLLEEKFSNGLELQERERELFGFAHTDISAEVTKYWNLPAEVQQAVLVHENPAQDDTRVSPGVLRLSEIVHAADAFVSGFGLWFSEEYPDSDANNLPLPIQADSVEEMSTEFLETFRTLHPAA